MPDLDKIQLNGTLYDIKDTTAREKDEVQDNELTSLKSALDQQTIFANKVFENGSNDYSLIYTNNAMNDNTGEQSSANSARASTPSLYYVPLGSDVYASNYNNTTYRPNIYCFDSSKTYLGKISSGNIVPGQKITLHNGTVYVRFFVIRKDDGNLTPQDAASAITFECVYNGRVSVLDDKIAVMQEKTGNIVVNNNLLYGFNLNDGYYDKAQHSSDAYKYFAKVPVTNGKTYIAYPRARMVYIYNANDTLINYLNQRNITQITAEGDGFAYITYYTADNLDSALFYEEGAENVYSRDSLALSDNIIKTDMLISKKWAVLGDSFTAGADTGIIQDGAYAGQKIVYPYLIGNRTGINVLSFFSGGRTLAYPAVPGDFINSVTCPGQTYYYQNIPSDVDYVTIYLGINDHHHLTGGGDSEDPTGVIDLGTITDNTPATYYGAWNVVISWLIANRPNAHIGIIVSNGITSTPSQESAHPTAEQSLWRKAQIDIAEKYGIPYIDLNGDARTRAMIRTSNPNIPDAIKQKMIENWAVDYAGGNYHPNNAAHEFESYIIEAFLRTI